MLPNQLTAIRLLLLAPMWACALSGNSTLLAVFLCCACATDAVDGEVARRLGMVTTFGAAFDSLADNLLLPSAACWLVVMRPGFIVDHPFATAVPIAIYAGSISVGVIRFGRFGNLHRRSSKWAGAVLYLFAMQALLFDTYSPVIFWLAAGMFTFSSLDTLTLQVFTRRPRAQRRMAKTESVELPEVAGEEGFEPSTF